MLHFSRWSMISTLAVVVAATFIILPNFFAKESVADWPAFLPRQQIVLGLDLQGGVYLKYEVDRDAYVEAKLRQLVSDVRASLREAPAVGYTLIDRQEDGVQVRLRDLTQIDEARRRLEELRNPLSTSILGAASGFEFDLTINDAGLARLTYSQDGLNARMRQIVQQSIEVIDRRINLLGTFEPNIQREGDDRIIVEAPGFDDPQLLKDLVGQTAEMTFHLVVPQSGQVPAGTPAADDTIVVPDADNPAAAYVLQETPLLRGEQIVSAQGTFDQRTNEPVVSFRLNTSGARAFAEVTQSHVGEQFAIVLDGQVISAPVIQQPILGGSGQITGNFDVAAANNLALLLRAGALPAKLTIIEERTIGPSLGEDSIRAGAIATIVATIAIALFMIVSYNLLGVFAVLALIAQNIIMVGILTFVGATLTLPGIAGIVLTMAMAVDANVLIYERMREEKRAGRSVIAALDQGFRRALATIVDAHLTALIAALALFWLGSGPIRGFAVTLGIGIMSTLFTAYLITRLIVSLWVRWARPKTIPI